MEPEFRFVDIFEKELWISDLKLDSIEEVDILISELIRAKTLLGW